MKLLNKTMLTTALLSIFMLSQPVIADTPDHNQAASGISISDSKRHANNDAIFGDEANHNNYSAGHSATDESHGSHAAHSNFTSAEHQAIKKLIFGNAAQSK